MATQPADRRNGYGLLILYTLNSLKWVCFVLFTLGFVPIFRIYMRKNEKICWILYIILA